MSSPKYRVRRATLDDLRPLGALWGTMNFAVDELARRITDFQVVESAQGVLLGATGLAVAERQGRVHSEGIHGFLAGRHSAAAGMGPASGRGH